MEPFLVVFGASGVGFGGKKCRARPPSLAVYGVLFNLTVAHFKVLGHQGNSVSTL